MSGIEQSKQCSANKILIFVWSIASITKSNLLDIKSDILFSSKKQSWQLISQLGLMSNILNLIASTFDWPNELSSA